MHPSLITPRWIERQVRQETKDAKEESEGELATDDTYVTDQKTKRSISLIRVIRAICGSTLFPPTLASWRSFLFREFYPFTMVSSRFRITLATVAQAASSAGSRDASAGDTPTASSLRAASRSPR